MKTLALTPILALAILAGCSTSAPRVVSKAYDGKWVGSIECYQRYSGTGPSLITRRVEWQVVNGVGYSLPNPVWQEWQVEFNGSQVTAQGKVADPRGQWSYDFSGTVTNPRGFVAKGYVYDGFNRDRVGRECKITGVLGWPA